MSYKKLLKIILCTLLIIATLAISICVGIACYQTAKSFTTTDFNLYLENGTYFEETASLVLPSKDTLDKAKIVFYEYEYNHSIFFDGNKLLRLVVTYDQEEFDSAQSTLETRYKEGKDREKFYFDSNLYFCYTFYNNSDSSVNAYAMAYSVDSNEKKISYLLYESFEMQVMSAEYALSIYFGENRITPDS